MIKKSLFYIILIGFVIGFITPSMLPDEPTVLEQPLMFNNPHVIEYTNPNLIYNPATDEYFHVKADNSKVILVNNESAIDVTSDMVYAFILSDQTDKNDYVLDSFICSSFSEMLHNNAEAAGIRCAWVEVDFSDNDWTHSSNAFNTTDKGIIFIDCTQYDMYVDAWPGQEYKCYDLVDNYSYISAGNISDLKIFW